MVGYLGGCLAIFVRSLTFAPGRCLFLLAGSVVGLWLEVWAMLFVFSVLLCLCLCCRCGSLFLCAFFQCFSSFSPLCSFVGQALFGHIKIMSVTAFFLMKNVLRHGREKKNS